MKPLPATPELLSVAERVVWFKTPSEALADPVHFLAHVMTYGTVEDLRAQIFDRSVSHHMRQEMHRIGQSFRGCLEPHHTLGHG